MIRFVTQKSGETIQIFNHGFLLGEFVKDADGFYYFWPEKSLSGAWSQELLTALSSFLEDLNRPWQREIDKYHAWWRRFFRWLCGAHLDLSDSIKHKS